MSATIIDSLLVTLGIDATKFTAGSTQARADIKKTTEESTTAAKQMEANGKQAAAFFSRIRNEALAMLAVFTGGVGIKNFVENTVLSASNLGRLSDNLEMSTERLTAYQRAAERAGGSTAGMTAQLLESQKHSAMRQLGQSDGSMEAFWQYGGKDSALKSGNDYLLARADIIANKFKVDPGQAKIVSDAMGVSPEMFDLMKLGSAEILKLVDAQEKHSGLSRQDADALDRLKIKYLDFRDSISDTSQRVLVQLSPALEKIMGLFLRLAEWIESHKDDIKDWIDKAVVAVIKFIDSFKQGDFDSTIKDLKDIAQGFADIAKAIVGATEVWDKWNAKRNPTPGVKSWGPFRFGKKDDLDANDRSNGVQSGHEASGKITYPHTPTMASLSTVQKLMAMGWTQEQAAGMVGSLQQESSLNSNITNPKSGAYGIAQWLDKSRIQAFKEFSGKNLKESSLDEQLAFMNHELTKGAYKSAGDKIRASNSAADVAEIHSKYYERPGAAEANVAQRQVNASAILSQLRATSASGVAALPIGAKSNAKRTGDVSSVSTSETNINGPITIQTAATDASGIAKSIGPALGRYGYVAQANTGMS